MQDLEMKQNILKEIMDLMEEKEGDKLKSHPKFIAAKVEVKEPTLEKPEMEESEEVDALEPKEDEVSAEDLQKLLAHFKGL